ncbi:Rad4 family protein [Coccidioides immitis RS]|uniref:Rad4 family protein n=1 Tax=Coccidioides immitis (strain RS) TaxID=246410 RepID=UPI0000D87E4E|nr:Rad4 family protein [Coccidioides immitis RS]EAS29391.3 Rad4 family protein [Coccidioides immitis RS]
MPPFVPRKDHSTQDTPSKRGLLEALDTPPKSATLEKLKAQKISLESDSSSLSSLSSSDLENSANSAGVDDDDDDEEVNWEDVLGAPSGSNAAPTPELRDLDITIQKNHVSLTEPLGGKKGPSKIERFIRIQTHCMHVQFLLFHNAIRNWWINDPEIHEILREKLPEGIKKEIQRWRIAAGLETPKPTPKESSKKRKRDRDWTEDSSYVEPNRPDLSRGDPTIHLLKVLAAYWKKHFKITSPGLHKRGYRPASVLEEELRAFNRGEEDENRFGEKIQDLNEFREHARRLYGSRDVGSQLFTALLRALGLETRLVASLQPIGFGWAKIEKYASADETAPNSPVESEESSLDEELPPRPKGKSKISNKRQQLADGDSPFPTYWSEVESPVTQEIIPVESLILPNSVAMTPELLAAFEPRGAKAEKAKQVIAYVVAYSPDATAKDVTIRYLRRQTWPGKTKGFRIPVEKPVEIELSTGPYVYDWFKATMRGYIRPRDKRTTVDEKEDLSLVAKQPEKKAPKEGDTLQSLKASKDFVLERFLRREEALRPGASHVRMFISGKGAKQKEEKVYRRSDVQKCLSAESWHKEGRRIKLGELPLKLVPIRAVTRNRKLEVDRMERETGEKPKQGLYALHQTEYIIPDPIQDGIIPKNEYGNIDCFTPWMVPKGAVHIPWPATVRVCKKLRVDYAEAVIGFEFSSKMAVPIIQGVVVAAENEDLVKDAWRAEDAQRRERERLKQEKLILTTWRKFIMGLRISERIQEEYGDTIEMESQNPFVNQRNIIPSDVQPVDRDEADYHEGGGFLVPGEDEPEHDQLGIQAQPRKVEGSREVPIALDNDTSEELSDIESV